VPAEGRSSGDLRAARERLRPTLEVAQRLGFLGPGPVDAQLDHALGFVGLLRSALAPAAGAPPHGTAEAARPPARVADLGTGGGVPGLVVAAALDRVFVSLVESHARRAAFLGDSLRALGLGTRAEVLHERAELLGRVQGRRGSYDAVTARSFGRPAVAAECAAPLLRLGGALVASEPPPRGPGPGPSTADRWPVEGLALLGMGEAVGHRGDFGFVVVRRVAPCPERYPRRVGVPQKRPLF
jgi:16S rRNA (guanine527-N7)-methyltransferase